MKIFEKAKLKSMQSKILTESLQYKAFTLAEVLITLAIIGVVAAITLPILMTYYQKEQTATKLEKEFSTISEAVKRSEADNGSMKTWSLSAEWTSVDSAAFWKKYVIPYLSVNKICTENYNGCWVNDSTYLDGKPLPVDSGTFTYVILNDGTSILFQYVCNAYGMIYVDLNNLNKPNILGKDIFLILLYYPQGKVMFNGWTSAYNRSRTVLLDPAYSGTCSTSDGSHRGEFCGALIQMDGWKIGQGYPW